MSNFSIVEKPSMTVVGIECRTSNHPEAGPYDIPKHWEKFYKEGISNQIPNKTSNGIVALYCNYEGDYTKPYSLVIGNRVNSSEFIPQEMVTKTIPGGCFAVFRVIGPYPQALIETWGTIWQNTTLRRTYTGDYELYSDTPQEVEIFIAIEAPTFRFAPIESSQKKLVHQWFKSHTSSNGFME